MEEWRTGVKRRRRRKATNPLGKQWTKGKKRRGKVLKPCQKIARLILKSFPLLILI